MATWITLSDADVRISPAERAKIDSLLPDGVDLATIVNAAANFARGYIGVRNPLADPPQIPPEAKDAVLAIALANYLAAVPNSRLLDDVRSTARDNAIKYLKDIAAGQFVITKADIEEAVQPVSPSPTVVVPPQTFQPGSGNLDGI